MDRENLLKRLTMLDFMAVDMQLFLDTHPDDTNAIAKYNSIIREADNLRAQYEKSVGPLSHSVLTLQQRISNGLTIHGHGKISLIFHLIRRYE